MMAKKMTINIFIVILSLFVIYISLRHVHTRLMKEGFEEMYLNKENLSQSNKEGFVSGQCPTTMIKKGNQILLYNPKMVKVPGVNPIVLSSLKEYKDYVKWQRANKINCPILHLERVYGAQGEENYEIKNSFLLNEPSGPLNHDLPVVHKTPNVSELLNAHYDNNTPYNKHSYPAFDPYNQNIGSMTKLDLEGPNPKMK